MHIVSGAPRARTQKQKSLDGGAAKNRVLTRTQRTNDSAAGDGADDHEWFDARRDCGRERRVGRLMRDVFVAGEESQERSPLLRAVIANRAAEHWVASFERVENRSLRRRTFDGDLDFAVDAGERSQMERQDDTNHDDRRDEYSPPLR